MATHLCLLLFPQAFLQRIRQNVADSVEKGLTEENVKVRAPAAAAAAVALPLPGLLLLGGSELTPQHCLPLVPSRLSAALALPASTGREEGRLCPRPYSPVQTQCGHSSFSLPPTQRGASILGAWHLLLPSYSRSGHGLSRQAHESLGQLHSGCGAVESGRYQWAVCVPLGPKLPSTLTSCF